MDARLQAGGGQVQLFSGLKKQGVGEAAQVLRGWLPADQALPDGPTEAPANAADPNSVPLAPSDDT